MLYGGAMRIWAALAVLFGLFHIVKPHPVNRRKGASKSHRQFYRSGIMCEELDALDIMNDAFEIHESAEKRARGTRRK